MISPISQIHFATLPTSQLINTNLLNMFCQVVKSTSPSCKGHFIIWTSKYASSCPNFEILQAFQCLKIYTLMCKLLLGFQNNAQENRITYNRFFFHMLPNPKMFTSIFSINYIKCERRPFKLPCKVVLKCIS